MSSNYGTNATINVTSSSGSHYTGTFGGTYPSTTTANQMWTVTDPQLKAELDRLAEKVDELTVLIEKLEIEARYWRIKSAAYEQVMGKWMKGNKE